MTLFRRTGSFLVLGALLACASDSILLPRQGLRFAFSQAACGPADGPAVAIFLMRDPSSGPSAVPPYVQIYIDGPTTNLDGRTHALSGGTSDAAATFHTTSSDYEPASGGYVIASFSSSDNAVGGMVDAVFPKAGHLVRGFNAPFFPNTSLCP